MSGVDVNAISEQIQAELQIKQFRDFLSQYNKLSEDCFKHCIWDFTSRTVKNNENSCVVNCVEKYTKVILLVSYIEIVGNWFHSRFESGMVALVKYDILNKKAVSVDPW